MKKILFILLVNIVLIASVKAQDEEEEKRRGFKKENLFTGGSISFGLSNNSFQAGVSPFLGYSLASWADAGITVNWNYASFRDIFITGPDDKIRKSTYGAGAFTRLYPVNFLFIQTQFEHNFTTEKFIPGDGSPSEKNKVDANSLLLGRL